jgi:hypothetical protein
MKGVNYHRDEFEKKFRWLNLRRVPVDAEEHAGKYKGELALIAWEAWCSALELSFKELKASKKRVPKPKLDE